MATKCSWRHRRGTTRARLEARWRRTTRRRRRSSGAGRRSGATSSSSVARAPAAEQAAASRPAIDARERHRPMRAHQEDHREPAPGTTPRREGLRSRRSRRRSEARPCHNGPSSPRAPPRARRPPRRRSRPPAGSTAGQPRRGQGARRRRQEGPAESQPGRRSPADCQSAEHDGRGERRDRGSPVATRARNRPCGQKGA